MGRHFRVEAQVESLKRPGAAGPNRFKDPLAKCARPKARLLHLRLVDCPRAREGEAERRASVRLNPRCCRNWRRHRWKRQEPGVAAHQAAGIARCRGRLRRLRCSVCRLPAPRSTRKADASPRPPRGNSIRRMGPAQGPNIEREERLDRRTMQVIMQRLSEEEANSSGASGQRRTIGGLKSSLRSSAGQTRLEKRETSLGVVTASAAEAARPERTQLDRVIREALTAKARLELRIGQPDWLILAGIAEAGCPGFPIHGNKAPATAEIAEKGARRLPKSRSPRLRQRLRRRGKPKTAATPGL